MESMTQQEAKPKRYGRKMNGSAHMNVMQRLALLELKISELEYHSINKESDELDEDPVFLTQMLQVDKSIQNIRNILAWHSRKAKLDSKSLLKLYNCERRLFAIQQILLI